MENATDHIAGDRNRILKAALDEFATCGLVDASIESIAKRANVAPGAARALFLDKATMLRDVLAEATGPMVSAIALAVEEIEEPKVFLRKSLQLYDQWLLLNPQIVKLLIRCLLDGEESLQMLYQQTLLPSDFYERLGQLIENRHVRCGDIFTFSLLLDSLVIFPHALRSALPLMNPEKSAEESLDIRFEAIIDLLEKGLFRE